MPLSGMVFINGGNLENPVSLIVTIVIVVVLLFGFCAQQMQYRALIIISIKESSMSVSFVYSSPSSFCCVCFPYYHFCAVHQQDEEIL